MVSPAALVGLLSEDARLRVVAALVLGATRPEDLLAATGLSPRDLGAALRRLESGGLVSTADGRLELHAGLFKQAARAAAPDDSPEDFGSTDPKVTAVLRAFLRGGRLQQIPTVAGKRRIVLEYLAAMFEPGVRYSEREVNAILRAWYDDHATLRRYLVDSGLLARDAGQYWRIGGWVDVAGAGTGVGTGTAGTAEDALEGNQQPAVPEMAATAGPGLAAPARPGVVRESRVGVYAVIRDGESVLLSRFAPGGEVGGKWMLPGGGVEFRESLAQALVREVYEETGLHVVPTALLDAGSVVHEFDRAGRQVAAHHVRIVYRAEVTGGTLGVTEVGGSTDAARWWRPEEITPDAPLTLFTRAALARW
jgi:8-oxo-dGTP pyrophosphatase MutT (NUDIX family)